MTASIAPRIRQRRVKGVRSWPMKTRLASRPASAIALATPGRPGADVVDPDQIRMIGEQPRREDFADIILIASLNRAQHAELRIFQADHLVEAEDALRVVAQRLRARDDPDIAGCARQ